MIITEEHFLEAIAADPVDVTTRAMYGDWLEERGETAKSVYQRHVTKFLLHGGLNGIKHRWPMSYSEFCKKLEEQRALLAKVKSDLYDLLISDESRERAEQVFETVNNLPATSKLAIENAHSCVVSAARRRRGWANRECFHLSGAMLSCFAARRSDGKVRIAISNTYTYNVVEEISGFAADKTPPEVFRKWADREISIFEYVDKLMRPN